ncbi:TrmB family transcriptional regulator [Halococcus hamelinensis]|uniref:TrmB family transcriptional regulator n=1 Tax=Halococcus hamelinensis TaxID=332168 RepID=UPI00187232C9|nr:helix-turn-helix domain-containing protein [Halococcus hamelinensis]
MSLLRISSWEGVNSGRDIYALTRNDSMGGWTMVSAVEEEVVELLQELGLKEYEAKCFAALTRLPHGTAKEISDTAEVPRTRVYEAVRVLESKGLVEIQQGNPQRFRAIGVNEAVVILADHYSSRIDELDQALHDIENQQESTEQRSHEVWSLTGTTSIAVRAQEMVNAADEEVFLVVGSEAVLTDDLYESLEEAATTGTDVLVGALQSETRDAIRDHVPHAEVFETGLEWLEGPETESEEASIGVLLMVDRTELLVSSRTPTESDKPTERAIYGSGFSNGLVVIARRLLSYGLQDIQDPAKKTGSTRRQMMHSREWMQQTRVLHLHSRSTTNPLSK